MRQREIIRTTLGELIVAVTDEVMPIIRDPSGLYRVVSYILSRSFSPPSGARFQASTYENEISMKVIYFLAGLSLSVLFSACAVIRGEDDGRSRKSKRWWRATIKPPSAIFSKPNKQTPTTYTARSYGKES